MDTAAQPQMNASGLIRGKALAWLAWGLIVAAVVTIRELLLLAAVIPATGALWHSLRRWRRDGRILYSGPTAAAAVVLGVTAFLILDWAQAFAANDWTCVSVKQISLAFLNHSDLNKGEWPAPAIYDKAGRPLLSWRVAILPFIDEDALYKQFHIDEAWDSPHNRELLPRMPRLYAAANGAAEPYTTPYQGFVGPGTALEGPGLRIPGDFPDGLDNTILIVEARDTVPWSKPQDLPYDPLGPLPKLGRVPFPHRLFIGARRQQDVRLIVAMVNGATRSLKPGIGETTLRAAITRNGGEKLGPDWDN